MNAASVIYNDISMHYCCRSCDSC